MNAKVTATIAVAVVAMMVFAAAGATTYSWFSDTEETDVTVSTATVSIDGKYVLNSITVGSNDPVLGDNWEDSNGNVVVIDNEKDTISISNVIGGSKFSISYTVTNNSNVNAYWRMYTSLPEKVSIGIGEEETIPENGITYLAGGATSSILLGSGVSKIITFTLDLTEVTPGTECTFEFVSEAYQYGYNYSAPLNFTNGSITLADIADNANVRIEGEVSNGNLPVVFEFDVDGDSGDDMSGATLLVSALDGVSGDSIVISDGSKSVVLGITLNKGNDKVEDFGSVIVTVPISGKVIDPVVLHNGTSVEKMEITKVEYVDGYTYVSFKTTHFSEFVVCESLAMVGDVYYTTLQGAINAATDDKTVVMAANYEGDVNVPYGNGVEIVIDGDGKTLAGTIFVNSPSSTDINRSLVIKNVNFNAMEWDACIDLSERNNNGRRYVYNLTVDNCTFNADIAGVAGIRSDIGSEKNLLITNCSANSSMHSLIWVSSVDGLKFDNCVVDGSVEGINLNQSTDVEINGCKIDAKDFAIRIGQNSGTNVDERDYTITNCELSADSDNPEIIIRADARNALLTINKSGDPKITNAATGVRIIKDGVYYAVDKETLQAAVDVDNDVVVVFGNDIIGDVTVTQKPKVNITIDGKDHEFAGVLTVDGKSATYTTAGLTIKNTIFKADSISADACIRLGDGTNATRYTCNVTVENCTFDVPGAVGVKSYTGGDKNLTIKSCTATSKTHSLVQAKGIDGILVENCTVYSKNGLNFNNSTNVTVDDCTVDVKGYALRFGESSGGSGAAEVYSVKDSSLKSANDDGDAVIVLRGTADNSTLTIENTDLTGALKITNTATNAKVIIDGKYYASNSTELATLIRDKVSKIILSEGEFEVDLYNIDARKTLSITGQGAGTDLKFKNLQVRASQFDTLTIENCEILRMPNKGWGHLVFGSSDNAKGVYTISNCIFDGVGSQGIYINENVSGATYNIENCTFNGDFGGEGAITIQVNKGFDGPIVNEIDCNFNNISPTSNAFFIIYQYDESTNYNWKPNTEVTDIDSDTRSW